jgi:hypothetical protein
MGEAKQKRSATQKLIEQYPFCYFCGGTRAATTREHMPPRSLFENSYRPDKLVMPACADCNKGTSTADLAVAIVSRWDYHSYSPDHAKLVARAGVQAPEMGHEWTKMDQEGGREKARRHLRNQGVEVPDDAGLASIGPLTVRQLNLFAHKAVLALYFEHFRKPLYDDGRLCAFWRSKEDFARDGLPQMILEMLPGYATLMQGRWNEQETFEYRHAMNEADGLFGCFARFRRSYFVLGFVAADGNVLPSDDDDWIKPSDLRSTAFNDARFLKRR